MANQMTIIDCDTWQGLYVNDELMMQDHSISLRDVIPFVLHCVYDDFRIYEVDLDWFDKVNCLPNKLQDVRVLRLGQSITVQKLRELE